MFEKNNGSKNPANMPMKSATIGIPKLCTISIGLLVRKHIGDIEMVWRRDLG